MKRGDPRLPTPDQVKRTGFEDWARRLLIRLYDRFREIDGDVDALQTFYAAVPVSVTLTTGTSTSTVSDLTTLLDGSVYHIDEATGIPGYDLECVFAGVERIDWLVARLWYDGTATHSCRIQLYNYVSAAYETISTVATGIDYVMVNAMVPDATDYISSGAAKVRFYHSETGNTAHNLDIDYVALVS